MVVSNSHSKLIRNQSGTLGEWQQLHKYAGNWRTDKEPTYGLRLKSPCIFGHWDPLTLTSRFNQRFYRWFQEPLLWHHGFNFGQSHCNTLVSFQCHGIHSICREGKLRVDFDFYVYLMKVRVDLQLKRWWWWWWWWSSWWWSSWWWIINSQGDVEM